MGVYYVLSVYLHIVLAAFWIGGMLFLPLVLLPSIKNNPTRVELLYKTGLTFRFFGWMSLGGLLVTGLLNMYAKGIPFSLEFLAGNSFGRVLGIKIVLFVVMLLIAEIHDFYVGERAIMQMKESEKKRLKQFAKWSGRINLLLALAIAFLGVAFSRGLRVF